MLEPTKPCLKWRWFRFTYTAPQNDPYTINAASISLNRNLRRARARNIMNWETVDIISAASSFCAVIFILCMPNRLCQLRKSGFRASSRSQGTFQSGLTGILALSLFAFLTEFLNTSTKPNTSFVVSLLTSFVATLGLSILLLLEQQRSYKPSDLVTLYLVAAIICDTAFLTVPSSRSRITISHPVLARCVGHSVVLILQSFLRPAVYNVTIDPESPEEANGVLGRVFFTWINPILHQGYKNLLIDEDLPVLSHDIKPEATRKKILAIWLLRAKPEARTTLLFVLLRCLKQPFLAAIIPRLFLIVFRYSQPVLIKKSIRFVTADSDEAGGDYGYWLIWSALVTYVGLAISTSVYQHKLNRLKLVTRSSLIGLIHDKTMNSPSISYENGESTTLMSTDTASLEGIGEMFHEIWAQVIEVIIGLFLLAREVGWIWPLPLFLIYCTITILAFFVCLSDIEPATWNAATQNRIAATASMLASMKTIKMLGFQRHITTRIQKLRAEELSAASKLRWIMVYYNASANALGIFSPAITLVFFAAISGAREQKLDTETAFTTIAILSMVTHPANMVMTIVPRVVGSFAGFDRIQTFLLQPLLHDTRGNLTKGVSDPASGHLIDLGPAITMQDIHIGHKIRVLNNISLEVAAGSMTIISGQVGSGKTTLLRTILGEIIPAHGTVRVSTRKISYCAQKPWLPSSCIREVIHGMDGEVDIKWYHEVIEACCLTHDLEAMPDGDGTQVGSRGLNLSGGQKQRVALARALFARCDIILLDDCFSGLDGETEKNVFENLLGSRGLLRKLKTAVILVSNSTQYFQAADQILVLEDGGVKECGTWNDIKVKASSIAKFAPEKRNSCEAALSPKLDQLSAQIQAKNDFKNDVSRQTGDFALYGIVFAKLSKKLANLDTGYYYRIVGLTNLLLLIGCGASFGFFITIPQYWLQMWTESSDNTSLFYIVGFLLLSIMSWTSTNGIMWSNLIRLAPKSGMRAHQLLLDIVTCAPLSFSQDIQLIDKQLPPALSNVTTQIFKLMMQAALLFVAQKWLALSLPACILVVYIIQKIYLRTSRQLRFLELESRAAVFSSFLECVEGLEAIRAFGWSRQVIQENISRVDKSQRPEFLLLSLQRWLNIVLDLLAAAIATGVVAIAVALRGSISGGQIGIALNIMLVANTTLLKLVENWTNLEISLGAVARLKGFEMMTEPEGRHGGDYEPPGDWPTMGRIEFEDVGVSYNLDSPVLQNINLDIDPGQKVIICGRTGSGKSTLLLTLLRLVEPQYGTIKLDGIDIRLVPLEYLRERCFITVSQDTLVLHNDTLRFNLDPDESLSDEAIIDALKRTRLWDHFVRHEMDAENSLNVRHLILDQQLSLFRELSVGQCQLFGLCRALVKVKSLESARSNGKPVVLLDEVTSSLDLVTEAVIYGIVEEEFSRKGYTVVIVAHRLGVLAEHMKAGRDVVVAMRDGRVREVITDVSMMRFDAEDR
ncbi:hypothetical protein HYFRA_00010296 [Hymenoscyphus fraxineus]|uniref:ABC transporter n=1 Tax=Hymenoscyphus fraxineus TaxID=746836 RepID=A0A9N9PQ63_9HELO|nr:hypothetical protein HYFRA_00010296 [Hymenoscyphus fraxineus]